MKQIFGFLLLILTTNLIAQQQQDQYLVVVSLDGFRADYPEKYDAKNIRQIGKEGVRVKRLIPSNPTKTFPNHYAIATGLYPDNNGLIGNAFYAADLGKEYQVSDRKSVADGAFYGGEPIWNTVQKAGFKSAVYYWIGSEAPVQGTHPTIWKKYDGKVTFPQRIDSAIHWLQLPKPERPRLVMLYYHEPDKSGHYNGPDSRAVEQQVKYVDEQVGNLHKKLMALPIADKINLIVLSDHGMRQISSERLIVLEDYLSEDLIDGIYGGNPNYNITAKKGKTDEVYKILKKIKHLKVYKRGEAPKHLHFANHQRTGDMALVAKPGWSIYLKRPKLDRIKIGGTHGYLNTDKQMSALFVAKGAMFKEGKRKGKIYNVDVYNLMTTILGIPPAPNDGNIRHIKPLLK